jgi:hypothetical protein
MKHFLDLPPDEFGAIDSPFLTINKGTYSGGDELILSMTGHREQITVGITKVITEKVHQKWCYLVLSGLDDLRGSM